MIGLAVSRCGKLLDLRLPFLCVMDMSRSKVETLDSTCSMAVAAHMVLHVFESFAVSSMLGSLSPLPLVHPLTS